MHAQGEINTHVRTINRKVACILQEWPQDKIKNSRDILF